MQILSPALTAVLTAALVLTGCGDEADAPARASDPAPSASASSPTAEPTVGSYLSYAPEDYTYSLLVTCFCPDALTPVRVTVADGAVVEAVLPGGAPAPAYRRLTINDVIEAANNTGAAKIEVTWPAGQDYPSRVYVDQEARIIDEEIGYEISNVVPG